MSEIAVTVPYSLFQVSTVDICMKTLVYGAARSGTTTLTGIIGKHPLIGKSRYEPLWNFREEEGTFDNFVSKMLLEVDLVKSIVNEVPRDKLESYFDYFDKVVFIRRRNMLRVAVSALLAKETKIWNRWDYKDVTAAEGNFDPIPVNIVKDMMKWDIKQVDRAEEILARNNVNYHRLYYEDLFFGDTEVELKKLYSSLGEYNNDFPLSIKEFINDRYTPRPSMPGRLNTERTYLKIPNVYEIERLLGSNETGWLLYGGLQK